MVDEEIVVEKLRYINGYTDDRKKNTWPIS